MTLTPEALDELAEAAKLAKRMGIESNAFADFEALCTPSTILSLVEMARKSPGYVNEMRKRNSAANQTLPKQRTTGIF